MGKIKTGVAKFIANKFLSEEMNQLKEQYRQEEINKVHDEMEYYKNVIGRLQKDKVEMSQVKFKEQLQQQTKHIQRDDSVNLEKNNNKSNGIDNPFAEYL